MPTQNTFEEAFKLAPFNPSSEQIQQKCFELLVDRIVVDEQQPVAPVLFDLGCGDARLLIACAQKYPTLQCVGIELDPVFATRAMTAIQKLPPATQDRLYVHEGDALQLPVRTQRQPSIDRTSNTSDLTLIDDATALYLFILPKGIEKLMPLLISVVQKRKSEGRNFRILSYMFKIHEWDPALVDRTSKGSCPIYLYEFLHD
eukprot:scaffold1384_cov116-Cylindrotheca_fusiformis.AAC.34